METCPGCLCWPPPGEDWPEDRTHHRVRGHKNTTSTLPQSCESEPPAVHPLHHRKQRFVHSQTNTVAFHTAQMHEAWTNQINIDSAPPPSSFKFTLCLAHSFSLWLEGARSNLLTSSEPQLDDSHGAEPTPAAKLKRQLTDREIRK